MVDASCFTLPYDYSLCEALGEMGCEVTLMRSEFRAFEWARPARCFQECNGFYNFTQRLGRQKHLRRCAKVVKAIEHSFNMRDFVARMRQLRPDVIHFQWLPVPALDQLYLRELGRIAPLVFTIHNTNKPRGTRLQSVYQSLGWGSIFRHVSAIVAHSEYSKRRILESGWVAAEKIHIVPHGAFDYYKTWEAKRATTQCSEPSVLFFGIPERYKGLDLLLQAFAALPPKVLNGTKLLVAGRASGGTRPLQELSRSLGIDHRVIWKLGPVSEPEVPELFASATVVAIPYRYIDISGVLMTALALGKAVVANRLGGNPDVIRDGVHGRLVDPEDPQAMAAALADLLCNPERRLAMERAAGQLAANELTWANSAQKTMALYESLVSREANLSPSPAG